MEIIFYPAVLWKHLLSSLKKSVISDFYKKDFILCSAKWCYAVCVFVMLRYVITAFYFVNC
jgi:hypothetical protein